MADTLTGGAGSNTFDYLTLANSLISNFDIINSIKASDRVKIGHSLAGTNPVSAAIAGTGNLANDIATALPAASFIGSAAAVVTVTGTGAGVYLVINDGTAGFQSASDAVIKLVSAGALTGGNFIA